MDFIANLRDRTIETFGAAGVQPAGYLLSTHRLTRASREHAHKLRDQGVPVLADNGSKALIDQLLEEFAQPADAIWRQVRDLRRQVGRVPRGGDVPTVLRDAASELAHAVVDRAEQLSGAINREQLLDAQLSMRPTALIAQEDFATGVMLALKVERETTGWPVSYVTRRNRRSLALWRAVAADPRTVDIDVYAVLSATDYNTARDAGRQAADTGVEHAAIGCAGFMLDRTVVDFYALGRATYTVAPAARRYVRFTQAIAGIRDGFADRDVALKSLHALGLGAATLFPLFAAAAPTGTRLTVDATSPIHDAVRDRVLYDPAQQGDRISIEGIVRRIVAGNDWPCACPFCTKHATDHGHHPDAARTLWARTGEPDITRRLLLDPAWAAALPLFAGPDADRSAQRTHIAHNHWVLDQVARATPRTKRRPTWGLDRIESLIGRESAATSRGLAAARDLLRRLGT